MGGDVRTELQGLRNALALMAEDAKGREPSVLFGARCLSCNRVFDEVDKEAGNVDLQAEKQREKFYSELQRAFHSPKHDPTKPIKVLSVKVGRAEAMSGCSGRYNTPYSGRDWGSLSCGVEDVQLMSERHGLNG